MKRGKANTSRYAILGILSLGARSGYDIKKLVERSIAHFWSESYGQIYPILRALEAEGLAVRRPERRRGRPDRHVYSLTPRGLEELKQWLRLPARPEAFRSELLLKLFLGGRLPVEDSRRHVLEFRQNQRALLAAYIAIERALRAEHARHPDLPFWLLTLAYGRHRAVALGRWADETLATLDRLSRRHGRRARAR